MTRKKLIRYAKAITDERRRPGGIIVVSQALVKPAASNLRPRVHVRRGDTVMVISGSEDGGRGKIGKVLKVMPRQGKIVVEGINIITRAQRMRTPTGQSGLIKKEAPIFASRVMLYDTQTKKPVRGGTREES